MIELDSLEKLKRKLKINDNGEAEYFFIDTCYRYMDEYVPKDKGLLRTIVDKDNQSITYMSPYAEYQYYGEREDHTHKVKNYTTPGTGPFWDIRMMDVHDKDVVKEVQDFLKRG